LTLSCSYAVFGSDVLQIVYRKAEDTL